MAIYKTRLLFSHITGTMKTTSLFLFLLFASSCPAQEIKPEEKLILGDTLVFLGIDFGVAKMINPADVNQATFIRDKHGPYWGIIDDFMCAHSNLKFDFEKKVVICKTQLFDSSYAQLGSQWIVSKYEGITPEQIGQRVKTYPSLKQSLGLVFIIDRMDKTKEALTMYGVYVDLHDNSVLKIIKGVGAAQGFGYSMYWATGVDQAYKYFTTSDNNYLHRLKHYFKKNK